MAVSTPAAMDGPLPIVAYKSAILAMVHSQNVTILVGETGCGKTSQVPQYLYHYGYAIKGVIAVTQPRRIAAVNMAKRVAEELRTGPPGQGVVGYHVRFDHAASMNTKIKFLTDGMLVRECVGDPDLKAYSVIVIDEAHERTVRTDVLLGVVRRLLIKRQDLKIVIMSATLEAQKFGVFFGTEVLHIPGRQYPVTTHYLSNTEEDFLTATLTAILKVHLEMMEKPGDILVFLPGQDDIEALEIQLDDKKQLLLRLSSVQSIGRQLHGRVSTFDHVRTRIEIGSDTYNPKDAMKELLICPIFAALPFHKQAAVFQKTPTHMRKVILATNIAETSITVSGVRCVIDCGLQKTRTLHQRTGMGILSVSEVSKASAEQRRGRAGREGPGQCIRLFTQAGYQMLADQGVPEISRCDLAHVYLELKMMGLESPESFDFLDAPTNDAFTKARSLLKRIQALELDGRLTKLGTELASLPLHPLMAKFVIDSVRFECTAEVLSIVSMLNVDTIFYTPRKLSGQEAREFESARKKVAHSHGDHLTMLKVFILWEEAQDKARFCREYFLNYSAMVAAQSIRDQLKKVLLNSKIVNTIPKCRTIQEWKNIRVALAGAFWLQSAQLDASTKEYFTEIHRQSVCVHPSSVVFGQIPQPQWIVYTEFVETKKPYIRNVTVVQPEWLQKLQNAQKG